MPTEGWQEGSAPWNHLDTLADGGFILMCVSNDPQSRAANHILLFVTSTHVDRPKRVTRPYLVSKRVRKNNPIWKTKRQTDQVESTNGNFSGEQGVIQES